MKKASCCEGLERPADKPLGNDNYETPIDCASSEMQNKLRNSLVLVSGGFFDMGCPVSTFPNDNDSPRIKVFVSSFRISPHAVSNAEFATFVDETGYQTVAEKEGWSFVFQSLLDDLTKYPNFARTAPWWRYVDGACWSAPEGPDSNVDRRQNHPVTHIAWYDAIAYCKWSGLRLPFEAEWEFAARGGLSRKKFPWGNQLVPKGKHMMNTWQGDFPKLNTEDDGWSGTAPVDSFPPNGFGLFNITGNVWEWVQDFYGPRSYQKRLPERDPKGPDQGSQRIQRGGSYLCHKSYCDRYHVHSRIPSDPTNSAGHSGFRVAGDQ
jgi:formylglycine-generating enzyme required for sulfatase activity